MAQRNRGLSTTRTADLPSGAEAASYITRPDVADPLLHDARHRQFGPLLEFSPDAIVIIDADGLVRECNPAAETMFKTTSALAIRASLRELLVTPHRERFDTAWQQLLAGKAVSRAKIPPGMNVGSTRTLEVTVAPIRKGDALAGAVVILRDPTAQPPVETRSYAPSAPATVENDQPAGLPGRRWLQQYLSAPCAAGSERGVAVCDIDAFATVLATYGPDTADAVLTELDELLRSLDTPGAFAHLRSDSFVWVVDTSDAGAALDECVATLTRALAEPFVVGEDRVWLTLSMGLATTALVGHGDHLAAATDALQVAKRLGGSSAVYYEESMLASSSSRSRLANDLHLAITHGELRLHYQPIMDVSTNEISGVEALVRWERPGIGLLAPVSFIEAAELTGQIVPLGNWVVRTACHDALRLGSHSGGQRTMSINISAHQLGDPSLIVTLREAMREGQCAPSSVVIEVTESVLLNDLRTIADALEAIKALDVGIDLDDFGTGYSSLQYLRNLPIDRLKVDQGFVAGLGINGADTAIVASTIALAHSLGLRAIAEGVETADQLALLREMGCDFAQGYLLSRPTDMETFTTWLDAYVPAEVIALVGANIAPLSGERGDVADRRDTNADRRESKADRRESTADARDTAADSREASADERERVADLRETIASEWEHDEDDREPASGASDAVRTGGKTSPSRRTARQARDLASAERLTDASDRALAGKDRDDASAARSGGARPQNQNRFYASDEVGDDD